MKGESKKSGIISGGSICAVLFTDGNITGISSNNNYSSYSSFEKDGVYDIKINGESRQGEDGKNKIGENLMKKLNLLGSEILSFKEPLSETGIDIVLYKAIGFIDVQITKAHQQDWKKLNIKGIIKSSFTKQALANNLKKSITNKLIIPKKQRKNLILALDALETPAYCFKGVINEFNMLHGKSISSLGFKEIWVVGPSVSLTVRLST